MKGESESNNNKSKEKCDSYSYFYGSDAEDTDSDAEDTDEEDWPQIDDETRRRRHLERGPHKKLCEEIRRMNTFKCSLLHKVVCTFLSRSLSLIYTLIEFF